MRDPKEGIALAAIVAKETTQGSFSGTGGGIGLGTGGPGVFIGGMSGSRKDQTERAKSLAAPDKASFNSSRVYAPAFFCMGIAVFSFVASGLISGMADMAPPGLHSASGSGLIGPDQMAAFSNLLFTLTRYIVPPVAFVACVLWFILAGGKANKAEEERFKKQQARDSIKEDIYHRLRYVESDHIVFDPVTFHEVPAERERIIRMLNQLTSEKLREEKGTQ